MLTKTWRNSWTFFAQCLEFIKQSLRVNKSTLKGSETWVCLCRSSEVVVIAFLIPQQGFPCFWSFQIFHYCILSLMGCSLPLLRKALSCSFHLLRTSALRVLIVQMQVFVKSFQVFIINHNPLNRTKCLA